MIKTIRDRVLEIDKEIRRHEWFDFYVIGFDGIRLTIAGGTDLTYYHNLEIIFENVFFVSCYFQEWHSNTSQQIFMLNNDKKWYEKLGLEHECQVFVFKTEDDLSDMIIAAKNVTFNTDTVYYYDRAGLKKNERIAGFVKR